ncbi:protein of unknown function (plasmid) [Azospirillum baldaniorum]|uniref:Uncharacterized protein n=1 Tax=Azospirillum baldaniorum TaxID=1064539 RepID=A0A9P1JWZ1_9PROT|nr:protein of unknown function [Azospirillum baldaniorum]
MRSVIIRMAADNARAREFIRA